MITYENVRVEFGDFTALPQLSLHIAEGEFFTLLGPSGCGKTTALRTLAGFETPTSGRVLIEGADVTPLPPAKRGIGMVFQNYALFPTMSVAENIAFGLKVARTSAAETNSRVAEAADLVQLNERQLARHVSELSGGQQQRVAIARALVLRPRILLLDEPLSNLDAKLRGQLREQLKDMQRQLGLTTVYVTHDQEEALAMSDRLAVFDKGDVQQVGTPPEIYSHPANEVVCRFVGDSSTVGPQLAQALLGADADNCYLRLEKAEVTRTESGGGTRRTFTGVVTARSYGGSTTQYAVSVLDSTVRSVALDVTGGPQVGDRVNVHIDPADVLRYPRSGATAAGSR